jgi:hypothetical protein
VRQTRTGELIGGPLDGMEFTVYGPVPPTALFMPYDSEYALRNFDDHTAWYDVVPMTHREA